MTILVLAAAVFIGVRIPYYIQTDRQQLHLGE